MCHRVSPPTSRARTPHAWNAPASWRLGSRGARLALVALILAAPQVAAQDTLDAFEEPHVGVDKVWTFTVLPEEANKPRPLVYRNGARSAFNLTLYDAQGGIAFAQNGARGLQTLPGLDAGDYRFFLRGSGEFQVTGKYYANRQPEPRVEGALHGSDAYALIFPNWTMVAIEGNVRASWWDLTAGESVIPAGGNVTATASVPYVLTLRGDEGAPYTVMFTPVDAPPQAEEEAEAPGLGLVGALVAIAAALLLARRA